MKTIAELIIDHLIHTRTQLIENQTLKEDYTNVVKSYHDVDISYIWWLHRSIEVTNTIRIYEYSKMGTSQYEFDTTLDPANPDFRLTDITDIICPQKNNSSKNLPNKSKPTNKCSSADPDSTQKTKTNS